MHVLRALLLAIALSEILSIPSAQDRQDGRQEVPPTMRAVPTGEHPAEDAQRIDLRLGAGLPSGVRLEDVRAQLLGWWGRDPLIAVACRAEDSGVRGELRLVDGELRARFRIEDDLEEELRSQRVTPFVQLWTEDESWWAATPVDRATEQARIVWLPSGTLDVAPLGPTSGSPAFDAYLYRPGNEPQLPLFLESSWSEPVHFGPLPAGKYVVRVESRESEPWTSGSRTVRVRAGQRTVLRPELEPYPTGTFAIRSESPWDELGDGPASCDLQLVSQEASWCAWIETPTAGGCALSAPQPPWRPFLWEGRTFETEVPAGSHWVQPGWNWVPVSLSSHRIRVPGEALTVTLLDPERSPGLRLFVVDAESGDELAVEPTLHVLRAGSPGAFPLRLRSGRIFAGHDLGRLSFTWRLVLEGYATAYGDVSAFGPPDVDGHRDAHVELRRGWGERLWVEHPDRSPAPELPLFLDGAPAGFTNDQGWCDLFSPSTPTIVEAEIRPGLVVPILHLKAAPAWADGRLRVLLSE